MTRIGTLPQNRIAAAPFNCSGSTQKAFAGSSLSGPGYGVSKNTNFLTVSRYGDASGPEVNFLSTLKFVYEGARRSRVSDFLLPPQCADVPTGFGRACLVQYSVNEVPTSKDAGGKMKAADRRGFTLTELVITMALSGFLCSVAGLMGEPMLANYRLSCAIKQLSMDLLVYRERAISEGTQFRVTLDVDNKRYLVERETAAGSGSWTNPDNTGIGTPLAVDIDCSGSHDPDIQFGASVAGSSTIVFSPRGIIAFSGANYSSAPGLGITNGTKTGSFTVGVTGKIGAITWSY